VRTLQVEEDLTILRGALIDARALVDSMKEQ
jgi:hypothetical protein